MAICNRLRVVAGNSSTDVVKGVEDTVRRAAFTVITQVALNFGKPNSYAVARRMMFRVTGAACIENSAHA
jgi:hypothetical protein